MTDHDLDLDRAEAAARRYFADEAAAVGFQPLDPDALKPARPPRRPAGWLVAAACAAAALVAVPLALRPGGPIAATPEPEPGFAWRNTAESPLSPRFGAFTAWLGDGFLVVGGWTGGPCPPGALCDLAPPDTRDGARYSPATNTWRPIAPAPTGFGRGYGTSAAALGGFYAVSYAGEAPEMWRYDPVADAWQRRAEPPAWGELAGSPDALLLVTGDGAPAGYRYDPEADAWQPLPAGPLDACTNRQGLAAGGELVIVAECGAPGATELAADPRVATIKLASGAWTDAVALDAALQGRAVLTGGRLVWPDQLTVVSSVRSPGIYDLAAGSWYEVAVDQPTGPLAYRGMVGSTGYFALDGLGLVAADGRLLDAATGRWIEVPDPGTPPRWDPVRAASPTALLDCFGYAYTDDDQREGRYLPGCRLLAPPAGTDPSVSPPPGPTGSEWRQLPAPDEVVDGVLLVAANDSFYKFGGYRLRDGIDEVQVHAGARLDPATGSWTRIADLPEVPVSTPYTLAADVVGTVIYLHVSFEESGEMWAYDTVADAWSRVGTTDETEYYLGTEDGLVRFRLVGEPSGPPPQVLVGDTWQDLPAPPQDPHPQTRVVRLDDHTIALQANRQVALLDTATRAWGEPIDVPQQVPLDELVAHGAAGALVFAPLSDPERAATDSSGPEIAVMRDGTWTFALADALVGAGPGIAGLSGLELDGQVLLWGRLFDPVRGTWSPVPALPGLGEQGRHQLVASGPAGLLTCHPEPGGGATPAAGCFLLRLS